ncbi:hypothetical protein LLH06_16700 [Mucilaginibacter daejeonensis]|uniref:hypothetical protein n=1 Tax=Mucilaginibacter daejeonensis TaxID=398049 RepID=UPI001D179D05|nr:hypothetical protein [Mucilaginibacter daejeonensis]UEG52596.1 hypothetical protein LLH06_16700 [Mucilaginibacter daejeonensis]
MLPQTKENPEGNQWYFLLMILFAVLVVIIKSPYLIVKGIYHYIKQLIADQHPNLLHKPDHKQYYI